MNNADKMTRLVEAPWSLAFRMLHPKGHACPPDTVGVLEAGVEAGGGQRGKVTRRADAWRSLGPSPRHHSHQQCRGPPAQQVEPNRSRSQATQEGLRAGAAALHCLCFPLSSCIHTLCFCTRESRVCQAAGHEKACTAVQSVYRSESGGGRKLYSYRPRTGQSRQGIIQRQLPG